MWMVLNYVNTAYPSESIQSATPVISPTEMRDYITIRESGWSPNPSDLEALGEATGPVTWELKWWPGTPPSNVLYEVVEDGLNRTVPTIAVVDAMQMRNLNRRGPLHAIVIAGMDERRVVINDPWGRMYEVLPRDLVANAWDTTLNRLVSVDLSKQSTLNEPITPEEDEE